jgi:hypothetical protein
MAISKTLLINSFGKEILFENSYIKVDLFDGNKLNMNFNVISYDKFQGIRLKSDLYSFALDLNGGNPIRQAYLHLKTLPEFATATDC